MSARNNHPGRTALLKAIESGKGHLTAHLRHCRECRDLYELLSAFHVARSIDPLLPSDEAMVKQEGIALIAASRSPARTVRGQVVFDSWRDLPAMDVRDAAIGIERRLRFRAGRIVLEFVAERQPEGWEFTAKVYENGRTASDYVLKVGGRKFLPSARHCYNWLAPYPPREIQLLSPSLRVDLDKLGWRSNSR